MEVTKSKEPTQGAKEKQKPELDSAIIDELKGYQHPEDMTGPGGILEVISAVRPTRPTVEKVFQRRRGREF
jgi:hypothetical protein